MSPVLSLAMLIFGMMSCGDGLRRRRQQGWRGMIPAGVCFVAVLAAFMIGAPLGRYAFRRVLPAYESAIRQMETGQIRVSAELRRIPEAEKKLGIAVLAELTTNGVLTVEFLTGAGFPVKHSGYLYCSGGLIEKGSRFDLRWPRRHAVGPSWFAIAD